MRKLITPLLLPCVLGAFVHPGVLISGDRIAELKSWIANGLSPAPEAYAKAIASRYSDPNWKVMGPPSDLIITCGSYSKPDFGCTAESEDGAAAYLQAMLYHLSGNASYAAKAMEIMDVYSHVRGYNDSNAPLQAAWGASKWSRAAELIIHSDAGWPAKKAQAFIDFLTTVSIPLIYEGSGANGNWELSMTEGMMGIAVLTENTTLLQHAGESI